MIVLALAMAGFGIAAPVDAARPGLIGGGLAGALLAYLDPPRRRAKAPAGTVRAKATILDAKGTPGAVAGCQMIELTLEVKPKEGLPFQVKRKFSAGRLGRVEQGRRIDVDFNPANPQRVELA